MTTQNTPVNINNDALRDMLRKRIQNQLGELIPEAAWDQLIKAEIQAFFDTPSQDFIFTRQQADRNYYGSSGLMQFGITIAPFRALVWGTVRAVVEEKLAEILQKPQIDLTMISSPHRQALEAIARIYGETLDQRMQEAMPQMVEAYFRQAFEALARGVASSEVQLLRENLKIKGLVDY